MDNIFSSGQLFADVPKKLKPPSYEFDKIKTFPVNIHKDKSNYDVFIGRGSRWGNPYSHLPSDYAKFQTKTRESAVKSYYEWIQGQPSLLAALPDLEGKRLGCFCYPNICHGDVLGLLADSAKIGENVFNNNKYYNSFVISENQEKIFDKRRLTLLAWLTESEYICIKKKGDVSGIKYIHKDNNVYLRKKIQMNNIENNSFGPGLHLHSVHKSIREDSSLPNFKITEDYWVVEITGKNVWYLCLVYSDNDKNNEILISTKDYGVITKVFSTQSELDDYINRQRKSNLL